MLFSGLVGMLCSYLPKTKEKTHRLRLNSINAAYLPATLMAFLRTCITSVPFKHLCLTTQQIKFQKLSKEIQQPAALLKMFPKSFLCMFSNFTEKKVLTFPVICAILAHYREPVLLVGDYLNGSAFCTEQHTAVLKKT